MKKVAINQSNYIPWKGFFDLIHDVDVFLFYDDVQYTVRDWRNRNRVKTAQGTIWLTVPVGNDRNRRICDVTIPDDAWQRKHWMTIQHAYSRAPHFNRFREFFRWVYLDNRWISLSALNQNLITTIAKEWLDIRTEFIHAPVLGAEFRKQDRILKLLETAGADIYISGPAARAYLDEEEFRQAGIELIWKDYGAYPEYPQLHPPFEHAVSIIDLLVHTGPDAPYYVWKWREDRV
jgi:uncharacterized protein Usg